MATITATPRTMDDSLRFARVQFWLASPADEEATTINDLLTVQVEWRTDLSTGETLGESYTGLLKDFPGMTTQEKLDAKAAVVALYGAGKSTSIHS